MKAASLPKRLPTPVALMLIFLLVGLGIFLQNQKKRSSLGTSATTAPDQIKVSNIGANSFVVSWVTAEPTNGSVAFGETPSLGNFKNDIRDGKTQGEYLTHFVVVDGLSPQKKYFFKVVSEGKSYGNKDVPFEITTAPETEIKKETDIAQGKIITEDGQPVEGALVLLSLPNAITQSALTDRNGYWIIILSEARTTDLRDYVSYDKENQIEEILVIKGDKSSDAILTTKMDNPAPDIVLGKSQNFIEQFVSPTSTPKLRESSFSQELLKVNNSKVSTEDSELMILYPKEQEEVNNHQPEFFGLGPKDREITITVESAEKINTKSQIDNKGEWRWSPNTPLSPGEHTITVSYIDKNGIVQSVKRTFYVLAAGESNLPSFSATPSANLTSPSPTPTTGSLSPTPNLKITITPSPTPLITATITPIQRTTVPSTESGTLRPGTFLPTEALLAGGIIMIIIGVFFAFH